MNIIKHASVGEIRSCPLATDTRSDVLYFCINWMIRLFVGQSDPRTVVSGDFYLRCGSETRKGWKRQVEWIKTTPWTALQEHDSRATPEIPANNQERRGDRAHLHIHTPLTCQIAGECVFSTPACSSQDMQIYKWLYSLVHTLHSQHCSPGHHVLCLRSRLALTG